MTILERACSVSKRRMAAGSSPSGTVVSISGTMPPVSSSCLSVSGHEAVRRDAGILRECAQAEAGAAEHVVAGLEAADAVAHRLHGAGEVVAQDRVLRPQEPVLEADQDRLAPQEVPVYGVHRRRLHPH
jgi:hypothetical protein